jgi:hypothetical protein
VKFRINLNSFKIITKESAKWPGKKLRFSITWWLEDGEGNRIYWLECRGCLAQMNSKGFLTWSPPLANGVGIKYNVIDVNESLHKLVLTALEESKWYKILQEPTLDVKEEDLAPWETPKETDV